MGHTGGGFHPIDMAAIRRDNPLPEIVGATAKLSRAGAEFKCLCPLHQERTPSFHIFDGGARWYCFGCGRGGDVLDYVQARHSVGLRDAAAMLRGGELPKVTASPLPPAETTTATQERARQIWCNAVPARGSPVERYLASRSITIPLPDDIRFARLRYGRQGREFNVMVALLRDAAGDPAAIQRTFLDDAGTGKAAVPKPKLSLGPIAHNAVRIGGTASEIFVTEGLEDAMSLRQMLIMPAWAACGAGIMKTLQFPNHVRSVVIGADDDEAGENAAHEAADAFVARGLKVRILRPLEGFKDFNAELMGRKI